MNAVTGIPEGLYDYGIDKNGAAINYLGSHAHYLDCTTNATWTSLKSCVRRDVGDGLDLYWHNINSMLLTLLVAEYFKPSLDFCSKVEVAWSSSSRIIDSWMDVFVENAGWIKGTSQMMSFMTYGVDMLDLCNGKFPTSAPKATPTDSLMVPTPSPSDEPTISPTETPSSPIACIDSPTKFLWDNRTLSCKSAGKKNKCSKALIQNHCPLKCVKCNNFKCLDSPLVFYTSRSNTFTCAALHGLSKKKRKKMCKKTQKYKRHADKHAPIALHERSCHRISV